MSESELHERNEDISEATSIPERATWRNSREFFLSCLNYAVGLGSVWRFPYLVYKNGGGAFIISYLIMVLTMGLPIFFLELIIGQYSGLGPNTAFKRLAPIFHGLGYSSLLIIGLISVYYEVIMGWTLLYSYASFDTALGWGQCNHDFNTPFCFSNLENFKCEANNEENNTFTYTTYVNQTCQNVTEICEKFDFWVKDARTCANLTGEYPLMTLLNRVLSSEEYYNNYAMGVRDATWEDWGNFRWNMALFLFLAWLITYFCIVKGVATIGRVVYFTSSFPYFVLVFLFIRGASLQGAFTGMLYYITPQWKYLTRLSVWSDAASQTFYALGIGCGSLISLSSFNNFKNDCHKQAIIVASTNVLTCIFAGFTVFSILGFMAQQLGVEVGDVVQSGPGLAFIAYPEAVNLMPLPQLWSLFFFMMLFVLGLGSQMADIEAINTLIIDHWPKLRNYKYLVTTGTCGICFILGLPLCFQGGVFLLTVMDRNVATWGIMTVGMFEVVAIAWIYGVDKFIENIEEMGIIIPKLLLRYWRTAWLYICPVCLLALITLTLTDYIPLSYGKYIFPKWVGIMGWIMAAFSLIPLPILAAKAIFQQKKSGNGSIWDLFRPSELWAPRVNSGTLESTSMQENDNPAFEMEEIIQNDNPHDNTEGNVCTVCVMIEGKSDDSIEDTAM